MVYLFVVFRLLDIISFLHLTHSCSAQGIIPNFAHCVLTYLMQTYFTRGNIDYQNTLTTWRALLSSRTSSHTALCLGLGARGKKSATQHLQMCLYFSTAARPHSLDFSSCQTLEIRQRGGAVPSTVTLSDKEMRHSFGNWRVETKVASVSTTSMFLLHDEESEVAITKPMNTRLHHIWSLIFPNNLIREAANSIQ